MKEEDKWIDDILDSSEKQDICNKIKQAIDHIEGMRVVDALDILHVLFNDLDKEGMEIIEEKKTVLQKQLEAMHMHSHSIPAHDSRVAGMTGTARTHTGTYTVSPEVRMLVEEIHDVKRDIRDLFHLYRSALQGRNLPINEPVSGVAMSFEAAMVPPEPIRITEEQRAQLRLSEEEIRRRSLMGR